MSPTVLSSSNSNGSNIHLHLHTLQQNDAQSDTSQPFPDFLNLLHQRACSPASNPPIRALLLPDFSRQKPPSFLFIVSMFSSIFHCMIHRISSWEGRLVSSSMVGIGVEGSEIEMDWGVRRAVWVV